MATRRSPTPFPSALVFSQAFAPTPLKSSRQTPLPDPTFSLSLSPLRPHPPPLLGCPSLPAPVPLSNLFAALEYATFYFYFLFYFPPLARLYFRRQVFEYRRQKARGISDIGGPVPRPRPALQPLSAPRDAAQQRLLPPGGKQGTAPPAKPREAPRALFHVVMLFQGSAEAAPRQRRGLQWTSRCASRGTTRRGAPPTPLATQILTPPCRANELIPNVCVEPQPGGDGSDATLLSSSAVCSDAMRVWPGLAGSGRVSPAPHDACFSISYSDQCSPR